MNKIIEEALSFIEEAEVTKSTSKEDFSYNHIARDLWFDLVKKTCDKLKIYFDLENDDAVGSIYRMNVKISDKESMTFSIKLCQAGGDWQLPTNYFRCQLLKSNVYGKGDLIINDNSIGTYKDSYFVLLPPHGHGNYFVSKNGKSYPGENNKEDEKAWKQFHNEKDAWSWVKDYISNIETHFVKTN